MSIASEITNYANGLSDAYDAVNDMQGIIPTDKNMNNLDTAIRTIPQSQGSTYTAGNGINIDANNEISIDASVVAEVSDLPTDFTGATSSTAGANGLVPAPSAGDENKVLKGDGTWATIDSGTTIFYTDSIYDQTFHLFKDSALTEYANYRDVNTAFDNGSVVFASVGTYSTNFYSIECGSYSYAPDEEGDFFSVVLPLDTRLRISPYEDEHTQDFPDIPAIYIRQDRYVLETTDKDMFIRYDAQNQRYFMCSSRDSTSSDDIYTFSIISRRIKSGHSSVGFVGDFLGPSDHTKYNNDGMFCGVGNGNTTDTYVLYAILGVGVNSITGYKICKFDFGITSDSSKKYFTITEVGNLGDFAGATYSVAGASGFVPAPTTSEINNFLKGDGTWGVPTNTTYSDFIGATSSVDGTNGLVPAPTTSDPDKFLKGDGTWATVPAGESTTVFYWNGSAMYKDSGYATAATISDVETAASAGPVKIYFTSVGRYEYLVLDTINAGGYFSTVWTDINGNLKSVAYTYASNTWTRTSVNVQKQLTASTGISIDASGNISALGMTGATAQDAGASGMVPAPAAGDQSKALLGNGTWGDPTAKLVEMSYGESNAWAKFIAAYNAGSIVYCRASSNANPATGSQTRKAFMAYVNNATSPTNVEFQYVRSQSSKTDSQQCDQVFVYKLTNASGGTWTVESRNMAPKINVDGPITKTFTTGANATLTIGASAMTGATSSTAGAAGFVPAPAAGDEGKYLRGDGTWQPTAVLGYVDSNFFRPGSGGQQIYKTTSLSGTPYTASEIANYLAAGTQFIIAEVYSGAVASTAPVLYFGDDGVGGFGEICYIHEGMILTTKAIISNHEWETV